MEKPVVLVVDDNATLMLKLDQSVQSNVRYETVVVSNATEAFTVAQQFEPFLRLMIGEAHDRNVELAKSLVLKVPWLRVLLLLEDTVPTVPKDFTLVNKPHNDSLKELVRDRLSIPG